MTSSQPGGRVVRQTPKLGSAFAPDRAAGLGGLLPAAPASAPPATHQPSSPPPVEQTPPAGPAPEPAEPPAASSTPDTKQRRAASRKRPTSHKTSKHSSTIPARLPMSLKRRLERYKARTGRDYARILLEAFEQHHHNVAGIFAQRAAAPTPPPQEGGLFPARPEAAAPPAEGTLQVNFTTRPAEREIIEGIFEQVQAAVPDLTAFIVGMLGHHLDQVEPARDSDYTPRSTTAA